ncbi:MAG TPA: hypothetical protein VIM86_04060 [Thermodesulfobacteriota bacterium]
MVDLWPWVTLVLLGAFHGLNPAMGWLFAVGLGLQERDRGAVARALVPIAIGHAASLAATAALVAAARGALDERTVRLGVAGVLVAFGGYRLVRGVRHKARAGMRVGFAGLVLWSFLASSVHGAGLMAMPALLALGAAAPGTSGTPAPSGHAGHASAPLPAFGSAAAAAAAVGIHTVAMLAVAGVIALAVFDRFGLGVLRRAWVNLDLLWALVLLLSGLFMLAL